MTTLTVYDPAMCCSTGICGTDIDQRLVGLAADLDWLRAQGVIVRRFGLSREPAEFAANDIIRHILQDSAGDDLPVFLVDGELKAKARYPGRAGLAGWVGVNDTPAILAPTASSGRDSSAPAPMPTSGCCGGAAKARSAQKKDGNCC
ncbi:MAG: arsenite efflux transporter metallochaperone ArsD [Rhodobacteraceae bacterium]|nr:arsenite efflux transporter metallochaperone ArsD [Paracoccaceae bacterium]